ncbi:hypothetical protein ACJRO7_001545 [Eucalyptus globulus]|uniref:Uncharacterized protein n=1 Tax=Eucalyptus globulus TaxID=34317 RepID=A0ABD3LWJ2_EUCGL
MVGSVQTSESQTSPPNLSPSSSLSSSTTPKAVIDTLCTHIADTTLTGDDVVQPDRRPFMRSQNVANPVKVRPPAARRSPAPLPPPPLSFAGPMELCGSDGVGGFPSEEEEEEEEECKTPRGEEYRIPEPVTCPPAPKRSRRHWSERRACVVGKEKEEEEEEEEKEGEESVDSSDVQEALKNMR